MLRKKKVLGFKKQTNASFLFFLIVVLCVFLNPAYSQDRRVDLEKSEIVNAEIIGTGGSKLFKVRVKLNEVSSAEPETHSVKKLSDISVQKCSITNAKGVSVNAIAVNDERLEYYCNFAYTSVRDLGAVGIKLTFTPATLQINQELKTAVFKNEAKIGTEIGDAVWAKGEKFLQIPVEVDNSVSATISLVCPLLGKENTLASDVFNLNKGRNRVLLNFKQDPDENAACKILIAEGDSLTDVVDFKFVDDNGEILKPKTWKAKPEKPYKITAAGDLKTGVILIRTLEAQNLTVTTNSEGTLKMFIDDSDQPESETETDTVNHKLKISQETILKLYGEREKPHKIRFEGSADGSLVKNEFPLLIDINPKISSSRIWLENDNLIVRYSLQSPVETYLKLPDLPDFQRVDDVSCSNGVCEKKFDSAAAAFIRNIGDRLGANKRETIKVKVMSKLTSEEIGELQFDVVRVSKADMTKFQQLVDDIRSAEKNNNFEAKKTEFKNRIATEVLGQSPPQTGSVEEKAIDYLIDQMKKDGTKNSDKIKVILRFAGNLALKYFGLPVSI